VATRVSQRLGTEGVGALGNNFVESFVESIVEAFKNSTKVATKDSTKVNPETIQGNFETS
jgi:hypothetical protein